MSVAVVFIAYSAILFVVNFIELEFKYEVRESVDL
jgi:hypothetical protein